MSLSLEGQGGTGVLCPGLLRGFFLCIYPGKNLLRPGIDHLPTRRRGVAGAQGAHLPEGFAQAVALVRGFDVVKNTGAVLGRGTDAKEKQQWKK